MSSLALLIAASCKTAVKTFFALPSISFIAAGNSVTPETPVGNILTEQMTDAAYKAVEIAAAFSCDLLMLSLLAPLFAGIMLCVLRSADEAELPGIKSRGLSAYGAGGLGYFFAGANKYRRSITLAATAIIRAVFWIALTMLPFWAVTERNGMLAFAVSYLGAGFPLLPAAIVISALTAFAGLCARTRRYAAALLYIEDPSISLCTAARRSAIIMRRHRASAAALETSFLFWWAAGFFTLGILTALYILPYYFCCRVIFFNHIKAASDLHRTKPE